MNEKWLPVVGYEGLYEVSNLGQVRSLYKTGRSKGKYHYLNPGDVRGYKQLLLCKNKLKKVAMVHRLVAHAFIGPPPTLKHQVNHLDFNKSNNVYTNLQWVTSAENNIYSKDAIPRNKGEANHSKLTDKQVIEMRAWRAATEAPWTLLAAHYKVSTTTCYLICKRKKWKHLP